MMSRLFLKLFLSPFLRTAKMMLTLSLGGGRQRLLYMLLNVIQCYMKVMKGQQNVLH